MNITTGVTTIRLGYRKAFTTFEVGKICGVFHTTVINWVNKGKLKARVTPGGHRRIEIDDLVEFMRKYDMPIPPDLETRTKKILIVEDDLSVQRMLTRALQPLKPAEVSACAGGVEALIAIGKEQPDLLVLDIRIPQVDGLEVCRILRASEQTRGIKIITVSGEQLSREEQDFLKKNADAFFLKPVSAAEVRKRAAVLLELEIAPAGA